MRRPAPLRAPDAGDGGGAAPPARREPVTRGITGQLIRAAEGGDAGSQFNLGVLYDNSLDDNGYATGNNRAAAIKWLLLAAQQDLPRAQIRLAEVYLAGAPVAANFTRACVWFLRAEARSSGVDRAKARAGFEKAAASLSPGQIAEARRLAGEALPAAESGR